MEKKNPSQANPPQNDQNCEDEKEKAKKVLQDIKVDARDVVDFVQARTLKKEIKKFEQEIDDMCKK